MSSVPTNAPAIDRLYSNGELLADAVIHTAALIAGAIGFSLLFAKAPLRGGSAEEVALAVYAAGFFVLFSVSFAYNMAPASRWKRILGRCDRSAIFVMIAATYTALLSQLRGGLPIAALAVFVWCGALGGAALNLMAPARFDRIAVVLYLALGWSAVVVIEPLVEDLQPSALTLVIGGGLLYSVGVAFYLWRSLKFQNAIWHGFVAIAAVCQFAGVLETATRAG
jgi:hemolysin III